MRRLRDLLVFRPTTVPVQSAPPPEPVCEPVLEPVAELIPEPVAEPIPSPVPIEEQPAVEWPIGMPVPESVQKLAVRYPECLAEEFPMDFPLVHQACERSVRAVEGIDLSFLARHSPGLRGNDWSNYLRCSMARMVRSLNVLRDRRAAPAKVLDFGSYLGNFSFMLRDAGYDVHALDSYRRYGECLSGVVAELQRQEISVLDFDDLGRDCAGLASEAFDAVICMGVIEHIPHTPRLLLETLHRILKPGGWLVLDTPNLGYLYKRQQLLRGESIYCPLELQYETELPFEGHHREFTIQEVRWMIDRLAHQNVHVETFLYSIYGLKALYGNDLECFRIMQNDPETREIILTASQKPFAMAAAG